jgi:hypothetical protein
MRGIGRIERTDGDVVPVRISERKLHGSGAGVHKKVAFRATKELKLAI